HHTEPNGSGSGQQRLSNPFQNGGKLLNGRAQIVGGQAPEFFDGDADHGPGFNAGRGRRNRQGSIPQLLRQHLNVIGHHRNQQYHGTDHDQQQGAGHDRRGNPGPFADEGSQLAIEREDAHRNNDAPQDGNDEGFDNLKTPDHEQGHDTDFYRGFEC